MALLSDDFWSNILHDDTDCGITHHADGVGFRSAHIASCFLELEKVNHDLEGKLRNDFNDILNSIDRLSLSPTLRPPSSPPGPPTRTIHSIHNPSFIIAAVSWLLENIANPYPSSTLKASLAQQHNCSLSGVNTWFINARRRIGWTTLCRDYFSNCRTDALDAAYRALVNEDPDRPLPLPVTHAFVCVKAAAENLYSSTFTSTLADDLDDVVRGAMLEGEEKRREVRGIAESPETSKANSQSKTPVAQRYYPSSDSSCSSSPVPPLDESLTDDSEAEEDVVPPILAGRKRRSSCLECAPATLSKKRRKRLCSASLSLETPLLSSDETVEARSHGENPRSGLISQNSSNVAAARKRRLSDADPTGVSKDPQAFTVGSRPHFVSDQSYSSLESDYAIDDWFRNNFDTLFALPPPVVATELDLSAQWEIELFSDYNIAAEGRQTQLLNSPLLAIGNQESTLVNSHTLDDFLQSLENGGFIEPPEITDPTTTISHIDPFVPKDWTSLFDWQTYEPSLDSMFGQPHTNLLPLPEIDLSILQLP